MTCAHRTWTRSPRRAELPTGLAPSVTAQFLSDDLRRVRAPQCAVRETQTRVLHVINQVTSHGGAEVSLNQMLARLQSLGIQNTLVGLKSGGDPAAVHALNAAGVRVLDPLGTTGPGAVAALVATIRRERPSVVHTSLFEADLWGRLASALTRTPVVVSLVNTQYNAAAYQSAPSPRRLRLVQAVDGLLARRLTSRLHAITETAADAAVQSLGVSRERITVVPRGRPLPSTVERNEVTRASARRRTRLPADARIVLNVGRMETQKGQVRLLHAFAQVRPLVSDAVLVIAGRRGNATAAIEASIEELSLSGHVLLLGARPDVSDLLQAADVFAFSSRWEGLGGSVLEAMAHQVPIVAYDIPAVREVTAAHARLVPMDDVVGLARGLIEVLRDPTMMSVLVANAFERVSRVYDPDAVATQMADLYRGAVEGSRKGRGNPSSTS